MRQAVNELSNKDLTSCCLHAIADERSHMCGNAQNDMKYCNNCKRHTNILRDYSLSTLVILLLLLWPAAIVYYYRRKFKCYACDSFDITEETLDTKTKSDTDETLKSDK